MGAVGCFLAIHPSQGQGAAGGNTFVWFADGPLELSYSRSFDREGVVWPTRCHDGYRRQLSSSLVKEKASRAEVEKRAAALEAEREEVGAKWHADLEAKQLTITGLQKYCAKQSASLKELRDEPVQLEKKAEGAEREVAEWRKQVEDLEAQVKAERLEKQSAQKMLQSERHALENLKVELDELRATHEKSLANVNAMEARLKFVSSEEGKKEVIEEYRHEPFGKVELSLAVKASFDYLRAQVPPDVLSSSSFTYPPRVQSCLPVLQGLE